MEGGYSTIEPLYPGLFFFTRSYRKNKKEREQSSLALSHVKQQLSSPGLLGCFSSIMNPSSPNDLPKVPFLHIELLWYSCRNRVVVQLVVQDNDG
jgi:hypothetical protein